MFQKEVEQQQVPHKKLSSMTGSCI